MKYHWWNATLTRLCRISLEIMEIITTLHMDIVNDQYIHAFCQPIRRDVNDIWNFSTTHHSRLAVWFSLNLLIEITISVNLSKLRQWIKCVNSNVPILPWDNDVISSRRTTIWKRDYRIFPLPLLRSWRIQSGREISRGCAVTQTSCSRVARLPCASAAS